MKPTAEILLELQAMESPLALWPRMLPYAVPEKYFEELASGMVLTAKLSDSPDPHLSWPKAIPYHTPDGYFAMLPGRILNTVVDTETPQHIFGNKQAMTVPEGYFGNFSTRLMDRIRSEEEHVSPVLVTGPEERVTMRHKVMPLFTSMRYRTAKLAVAAMLVIGIGFGIFRFASQEAVSTGKPQMAAIPEAPAATADILNDKQAIAAYMEQNIDDFETDVLMENLTAATPSEENNSELEGITDEELLEYLTEEG